LGLVSKQCVDFVKKFEGFYSKPYKDMVGVKTLGYGMTGVEIQGLNYVTEPQASKMLEDLLNRKYAQPIKNDLDRRKIHLNQNQFDALVSMAYNVGYAGVLNSTLYRHVCNGTRDRNTITNDFCMWCKAGGKTVYGLLRRRREEANMFFGNGNVSSGTSNSSSGIYGQHGLIRELQQEINNQGFGSIGVDGIAGGNTLNNAPMCKQSAKGNITKVIQKMLINIGYPVGSYGADGVFGGGTVTAVKAFQRDCGLFSDGIVGQGTWKALFRNLK
jgi:GH24 family phage-related lysozyme (muramidase)